MIRAWAGGTLLFCAAALAEPPPATPIPQPPEAPALPPPSVLAHLRRGVNLSHWFQQGDPADPERYVLDEVDWLRLRALRLDHVRVLVDPAYLLDAHGLPRPAPLAELRSAIDAAAAQGMLVVIALELPADLKASLAGNEPARVALAGIWRTLAMALRDYPVERIVFEPLNGTALPDAASSRDLESFLVAELRAVVPAHTLAVSGHGNGDIAALTALEPLADRNLVYTFHFYEPYEFTHQGATWAAPAWRTLRNFPYPSSPRAVAAVEDVPDTATREILRTYGRARWNRDRVRERIERAAQWAAAQGVPEWCGEFGVLRTYARPEHRRAWLRDVRSELEAHGIGWTHWDYAGDFGMVSGPRDRREPDALLLDALGLPGPPDLTRDPGVPNVAPPND